MVNPFFILHLTFLLICSLLDERVAEIAHATYLHRGSSLSVKQASDVIRSPDGSFSFGLYNLSSTAFTLSIWFTNAADRTIAWTANRDRPVHGSGSKVTLNKDGSMVLRDYDGTVVWEVSKISAKVDRVELMDTGNLVMVDQGGNILWQSFDHPTDTLLPGQSLTATTKLVSTNPSHQSSYYTLRFDERYILSLSYDGPDISNLYWPNPDQNSWSNYRILYKSGRRGVLDKLGQFEASDNTSFIASDWGLEIKRRLTLDYDGNLRLYSLNESDGSWYSSWMAFSQLCDIHGLCGWNALCVYTPAAACTCPRGYVVVDPNDWSKGCKPQFNITCGKGVQQMGFVGIPWTDFWGSDMDFVMSASLDTCRELCLARCSCVAFVYKVYPHPHGCFLKSGLFNGKTTPGYPGVTYVKVPESFLSHSQANSSDSAHGHVCNELRTHTFNYAANRVDEKGTAWYYYYSFLAAFFLVELCFIAVGWWFMTRKQSVCSVIWAAEDEEGFRVVADHFRSFTHKELQKATNNFMDELGHGRHGSVYKGILHDNRVVAVKKLKDMKGGEAEFETEVSVIGRIYHMNLVRVMGVCSEGTHRLLVYEFVENGSLDMFLFGSKGLLLQWHHRYKIAVGVAKGLAYLHHECMDWIIHCDVKPENILLDEEFEPKISDFGFAKLLQRDESDSDVSKVRGTRGYMAPEWVSSAPVTEKVDVYSFGVVLLELVMGHRMFELPTNGSGDAESALRQLLLMIGENKKISDGNWIDDLVDPRLNGDFVRPEVLLMLEVAALCLEQDKNQRPSMSDVVQKFLCR
ncbi:putative receptor protein kinase ZmPK1 [Miscanthus floridulus]|uniref:putative receptor protein kinase ZmPK1 n=1 Tax=Miscanthus floridulus TaxID=154761 RepID=UPI0034598A79